MGRVKFHTHVDPSTYKPFLESCKAAGHVRGHGVERAMTLYMGLRKWTHMIIPRRANMARASFEVDEDVLDAFKLAAKERGHTIRKALAIGIKLYQDRARAYNAIPGRADERYPSADSGG